MSATKSENTLIERLRAAGAELNCQSKFSEGMACYEAAEKIEGLESDLYNAMKVVCLLIAESGGQAAIRRQTMLDFDVRSVLETYDDPVSGNRVMRLSGQH